MEISNALQDTRIDARCSSSEGVCIPDCYTINDSICDEAVFDDFDPDAEIERDIQRSLEIAQNLIADAGKDPTKPLRGKGPVVYIGFDTEYLSGDKDHDNTVLSLQFYLIGERGVRESIVYPNGSAKADRPHFDKVIVKLILDAMDEGVILEWPKCVVVCGFFLRTDLQAFGDFVRFKHDIENVAGRAASVTKNVEAKLDAEDLARLLRNRTTLSMDSAGVFRSLGVRFVDVGNHTAMGTSLSEIGDLLRIPKLELPDGYKKDEMDKFMQGDKKKFEEYGLRDAEIAVRFYLRLLDFADKELGKWSLPAVSTRPKEKKRTFLPPTASSLAVAIFKKQLEHNGDNFNAAFGFEDKTKTYWNSKASRLVTKTEKSPIPMRAAIEAFITSCYSGGRNECFAFGPTTIGEYNDFDLAGAYTTGMVDLRHIDYEKFRISHDPADFVGHVLGFAYVRFAFPADTLFPSLPVRNKDNGLVYPLSGYTHCTAPEIEVALTLGCVIEVKHGVIIPWCDGDERLFEPYVMRIRELRAQFKDDQPVDEKYAKLLGNSLYGKTAQGLKKKTVFDSGKMESIELPHSGVTNAAIAAHTTGFIRALLSELIALIPSHRKVISATTDGFLTDADKSEVDCSGPMAMRFQALCERVAPGKNMLEPKHKVRQLIAMKTRGQITAMPFEGEPIVLAKAGVSPGPDVADQNEYMVDLFLRRNPKQKTETRPFTPFREQWVKDIDMVRKTQKVTLNLEFDFKRQLVNPYEIAVTAADHVVLDSVPWTSLEECERARAIFNGWRSEHCLKTLDDFEDWDDHYRFAVVRDRLQKAGVPGFGLRATNKGVADVFRRLFLRAYAQELCGLTKTMTYPELADWLTSQGYPTTTDDLKNAKRAQFVEHAIPVTARVSKLASVLVEGFPGIDINKFYESN